MIFSLIYEKAVETTHIWAKLMSRDAPSYLPDEADINYRAMAVRWFTEHKWAEPIVDDIMYYENPTIDTVERLVRRYGPVVALEVISKVNQ